MEGRRVVIPNFFGEGEIIPRDAIFGIPLLFCIRRILFLPVR